jgi:hypothetical protein
VLSLRRDVVGPKVMGEGWRSLAGLVRHAKWRSVVTSDASGSVEATSTAHTMDSRGDPAFLDVERRARQVGDPINSLMEKIDEAADVLDGFRREGLDVSDARVKKQYATLQLYCQIIASPKKEQSKLSTSTSRKLNHES